MIRLIVSDLDGTLLDGEGRLPEGFFSFVRSLYDKGIRFCAASGRQYFSLKKHFEPVKDIMLFAAENGALVMDGGKQLLVEPVPTKHLPRLIDTVWEMDGVRATICTVNAAYYDVRKNIVELGNMYENTFPEDNLRNRAIDTDICKLSVYDQHGAEHNCWPILSNLFPDLQVVLSGNHYCDVMKKGVNKGTAVSKLQNTLHIKPEECMAFGDYLNDIPLMQVCGYSYAVENAHPLLKRAAGNVAPSNKENGVVRTIQKVLEEVG